MSVTITRTAWTDDDGSGTTGTVINNAVKTELYGQIDTALALLLPVGGAIPTVQTTTSTGAQNNFSLSAAYTYLRVNNASAVTFSGFTVSGSAPGDGDVVIIDNIGTSTVLVTDQDTNSTAANRIITPSTAGQIIGANGRMICVYDATTGRWRESVVNPGAPIVVAYDGTQFTASSSTWTVESGDIRVLEYSQRGKLVDFLIGLVTTSVGGTPSTLSWALSTATGFTPTKIIDAIGFGLDNTTSEAIRASFNTSGALNFTLLSGSNWQTTTNLTNTCVNQTIEVN